MAATPDTVVGHWSTLIEGLKTSPLDFYTSVETAVKAKSLPDTKMESIEYREGGAFSPVRKYWRVRRHRLVFDICAAPFGTGSFFSWWLAEVRSELPTLATILVILGYLALIVMFVKMFGLYYGVVILFLLLPLCLFLASRMGTPQADDLISMLPGIGWLYVFIFRPTTYYRLDTTAMFRAAVEAAVMECVDKMTEAQGLRALTELERKPVMREFFRK